MKNLLRFAPTRGGLLALAILTATVASPVFAFAQAATTVNAGDLFGSAEPTIERIVGVVIGAIVGFVVWTIYRVAKVTIDQKMRDMLQSALVNAAHVALVATEGKLDGTTIDLKSPFLAEGVSYLRAYLPKVLAYFKLTDADIAELVRVQLAKITPTVPTVAA